jgi:hypothetical protein
MFNYLTESQGKLLPNTSPQSDMQPPVTAAQSVYEWFDHGTVIGIKRFKLKQRARLACQKASIRWRGEVN